MATICDADILIYCASVLADMAPRGYKVARKHAGGAGEASFAISMSTLFEKSGAERQYRRFKFELAKIAERDELPE